MNCWCILCYDLVNCPSRWSLYLSLALCVDHLSLSIIPTSRRVQQCTSYDKGSTRDPSSRCTWGFTQGRGLTLARWTQSQIHRYVDEDLGKNIPPPRSARDLSRTPRLWNCICGCTPARSLTCANCARSLSHRWIFRWNILDKIRMEIICEQHFRAIIVCDLFKKSFPSCHT